MFQTEISFDSKFFDSLKVRWLKTKEIYILLQTVDELINNNDIELTNKPLALDTFSYYFCDYYDMNNWTKFENYIKDNGLPDLISFDNDLGIGNGEGYDCAKWLVNYCLDNNVGLPQWFIHSANPVAKENISKLFKNFEKIF